ncbi:asparaginase [Kocuria koreensis]|jgi:L-asparaginase|uniref:asparaginase n=1 Tax=Rothia koreensis TaxID=592378 RepID=A0A7K1LH73_9MICC|nr:asparaginase [Rothia koreensis]MUN54536.1 asparaginase [Rothia koreensis]
MPLVQVLGTGGTIASHGQESGGAVASSSVDDLMTGALDDVEVRTRDVMMTGSYRLGLSDLRKVVASIEAEAADPRLDGIVVTHGTDTLEESAFLAELVRQGPAPVVFTGAQRTPDEPDADGPRNLHDAIRAASASVTRGWGSVVCFNGRIHSSRGVFKSHTLASNAFTGCTVLAEIFGRNVYAEAAPARRPILPQPDENFDSVRVEIIPVFPGSDPSLMDWCIDAGAHGVVLLGTGSGNAGPGYCDVVRRAVAAGVPVILASRVPFGPIRPLYGNGGGVDLERAGAVPAGTLGPYQARILTALLISHGFRGREFTHEFTRRL